MSSTLDAAPIPLQLDAGGVARVAGTRVTLDTIVAAFTAGATAEEIATQFPVLDLADIYATIGYYLRHRAEVEAYLHEQEQTAAVVRQTIEGHFDPTGIRDRLLARKRNHVEP